MQLARTLKFAGLNTFPCAINRNEARNKWEKRPITVDHEPWSATADRPLADPRVNWKDCRFLGLPIPASVVILDLDTYEENCTRDNVDTYLGTTLPWNSSLIQTTIGGGEHHAFRVPSWKVKQGSNFADLHLDTRVGKKGFICSGEGYTAAGAGGVVRLAYPESLPILPDCLRELLEDKAPEKPDIPLVTSNTQDTDDIIKALHHVDPGLPHDGGWIRILMALHNEFKDDMETGYAIAEAWSSGAYWPQGMPANYDANVVQHQFYHGTKAEGGVTIGSVFFDAIQGGWTPPPSFDASAAFGEGAAAAEVFTQLVARVIESGTDSKEVPQLLIDITMSGCNILQTSLLRNELKSALKGAGLLDAGMRKLLDDSLTPEPTLLLGVSYRKNHTENAQKFLAMHYPYNTLMRSDEIWYAYDSKIWVEKSQTDIEGELTTSMVSSFPQKGVVAGTYGMLASMIHRPGLEMSDSPDGLVIFQNGVLDLKTGIMYEHSAQYLTTKIVPYNYNLSATAPTWLKFVNEVFEDDAERIALLQEWLGYMISPSYLHQKVMLLLGPPRCGKGTIGKVLEQLVGSRNFTGGGLISFASDSFLESLQHKTVLFSGDTAKNISRNHVDKVIETIKKISGNDAMAFDRKYISSKTCTLPTRITLAGNNIPRLFDDSSALSSRMLVLTFDVSYEDREDLELTSKLLREIEGIATWALQGLSRLNKVGRFTRPAASSDEVKFIMETYSPLRSFIESACILDENARVSSTEIYDAYRAWAVLEQEGNPLARKTFITALKDATRGQRVKYGTQRRQGETFKGFSGISAKKTSI